MFLAIEESVEESFCILDSNVPNLNDTAFAFEKLLMNYGEPLPGSGQVS